MADSALLEILLMCQTSKRSFFADANTCTEASYAINRLVSI